ncbi:Tyrosine protein kinase-like protein [Eptesipox virus]|uniref:Tyrosine protein kinase-like protein n=1 Tax=Eptesipox virus TaxID=1329402 RepID=A0A220T6N1_9POXV|nr:Tyrosine protein kinase-like protein [Eptesipox virus]ASK51367.1 Tyrosine protein kinase-like protein [Eptesipox virus]WAH71125.1 tyrosine protein kinase-like protein [Eptesipox virus]
MFMYKNTLLDVSNTFILLSKKSSFKKLSVDNVIKNGTFYTSENCNMYTGMFDNKTIAIKEFIKYRRGYRFMYEIFNKDINICKIHQDNLLLIYGYIIEKNGDHNKISIIMDYCKRGYLRDVLINEPNLMIETRIDMIIDAVYALICYYNYKPLHEYISTISYMVTENYKLKLLCMGLERHVYKFNKHISSAPYISLKCYNDIYSTYNKKDDIYSLGIVMWEIITGKIAFENKSSKEIRQILKNGETLSINNNNNNSINIINSVISEVLNHDENIRPSIETIYNKVIVSKYK